MQLGTLENITQDHASKLLSMGDGEVESFLERMETMIEKNRRDSDPDGDSHYVNLLDEFSYISDTSDVVYAFDELLGELLNSANENYITPEELRDILIALEVA